MIAGAILMGVLAVSLMERDPVADREAVSVQVRAAVAAREPARALAPEVDLALVLVMVRAEVLAAAADLTVKLHHLHVPRASHRR